MKFVLLLFQILDSIHLFTRKRFDKKSGRDKDVNKNSGNGNTIIDILKKGMKAPTEPFRYEPHEIYSIPREHYDLNKLKIEKR